MDKAEIKKSDKISRVQHQNDEKDSYNFDVRAAQVKRQLIAILNQKGAR